ncbi:MAG: hypothetical protein KIT25_10810 [Enhydrobacter sp.]|nr:MAG: hypothetical protein KIT25_10810 [Enhydrobacter sp.]
MRAVFLVLAINSAAPKVAAQSPATDRPEWSFSLAPYAWLMGVNGNVTAAGQTVDVNANFIDILGKTDTLVGLMAYGEARKDRYGLYFDFVYTQLTASGGYGAARNPLPKLTLAVAANGGVKSTLIIAEAGGMYEVWRQGGQNEQARGSAIDAILGVRYWHASSDLSFAATADFNAPGVRFDRSGGLAIFRSGSLDWADPILGLRLRQRLAPQHEVRLRGDIGGFGVGSQLTWQLFLGYGYEFSSGPTSWSALLGYRALGVNYTNGWGNDTRGVDAVMHGPVIGAAVKF